MDRKNINGVNPSLYYHVFLNKMLKGPQVEVKGLWMPTGMEATVPTLQASTRS